MNIRKRVRGFQKIDYYFTWIYVLFLRLWSPKNKSCTVCLREVNIVIEVLGLKK